MNPRLLPLLCAAATLACAKSDYAHLYKAQPLPPSFTQASVEHLDHLGATLVDQGVNFSVYSENATRVELALFDDPEASLPTRQFLMTKMGNVWNVHVGGVGLGQAYGYIAWGPNWPYDPAWYPGAINGFLADVDSAGNRFNPNKLLFDPYSRALHRDHDWSKGSLASGPARTSSTYAAASKSVVVQSTYQWSASEVAWRQKRLDPAWDGHKWNDLILYEVHPKGFTASPASGVKHPGTFRGVGEKADYLAELGITAVELMPVFHKPSDGGYWGYQTIGFFAPNLSYASDARPGQATEEFKWMVDELHKRNIEVILDVVYNHTGEGGLWREKIQYDDVSNDPTTVGQLGNFDAKEVAGLYSFRGLDNQAYYALSRDNQTYWNNTGVGDETRANHAPMRRLILDSLHYWEEEMHVDGFRFDLAAILGEKDLDYTVWDAVQTTVLQDIADDPVLQRTNTRIIAEPWAAAPYGVKVGQFPAATGKHGVVGWYEWNDRFRDLFRQLVNDDNWKLNSRDSESDIGAALTGLHDLYSPSGRKPYHGVNFASVHDGFTQYDLFSYVKKVDGCGPLNPICCSQPASPFCDHQSGEDNNHSRDWGSSGGEPMKRQLMRNLFVAMLLSHGTPLLLGGDEWMRTQLGNNNAYSTLADNSYNWYDWGSWQAQDERFRMKDFVAQLTRFRVANRALFAPAEYGAGAPFAWKSENNDNNVNWSGKHLAMHYYDGTKGRQTLVLLNMEGSTVTFQLPLNVAWQRVLDTQQYFDSTDYVSASGQPRVSGNISTTNRTAIPGAVYDVPHHTIVVLQEAQ